MLSRSRLSGNVLEKAPGNVPINVRRLLSGLGLSSASGAERTREGDTCDGGICSSEGEEGASDGCRQNGESTGGVEGEKPGDSKLALPLPKRRVDMGEGLGLALGLGLGLMSESDPESRELLESRCRRRRPALGLFSHGGVPSQATAAVMSSRRPRALVAMSTTRSAASAAVVQSRTYLATLACVRASQTPSEQRIRAPPTMVSYTTVCTAGTAQMAAPQSASPIARQTAKPPGQQRRGPPARHTRGGLHAWA